MVWSAGFRAHCAATDNRDIMEFIRVLRRHEKQIQSNRASLLSPPRCMRMSITALLSMQISWTCFCNRRKGWTSWKLNVICFGQEGPCKPCYAMLKKDNGASIQRANGHRAAVHPLQKLVRKRSNSFHALWWVISIWMFCRVTKIWGHFVKVATCRRRWNELFEDSVNCSI